MPDATFTFYHRRHGLLGTIAVEVGSPEFKQLVQSGYSYVHPPTPHSAPNYLDTEGEFELLAGYREIPDDWPTMQCPSCHGEGCSSCYGKGQVLAPNDEPDDMDD